MYQNAHFACRQANSETLDATLAEMATLLPQFDLAMVLVTPHHAPSIAEIGCKVADALETEKVIGCSGQGLIVNSREWEGVPAISIWAAHLPNTEIATAHLNYQSEADGGAFTGWTPEFLGEWPEASSIIALAEPFTFPTDVLLARLNEDRPGVRVWGGICSGSAPGEGRLFLGREACDQGAVLVRLAGDVRIHSTVSQGCRPIGEPMVVTKAEVNEILELGGRPALAVLKALFQSLPAREQRTFTQGLHVGRVINEYQDKFEYGDFLIRNVGGMDAQRQSIAITDFIRAGQTIQFHLRDHQSASADLEQMLKQTAAEVREPRGLGGLLFSCNGRGSNLFPEPNHDAGLVQRYFPQTPLNGFFAAGEIGPVAGQNFIHGFTASLALMEVTGR